MKISALKETIFQIEERIKYLRNSPSTRMSAMGTMIQETYIIREWEELDEKVGKLRAQLHLLENPTDNEEEIQLIYYGHNHIIPTYSKNGILTKGGLLDNYFTGRLIGEHNSYAITRHGKYPVNLNIIESTVNKIGKDGTVTLTCKIGEYEYSGQTNYWLRCEFETHFQFCKRNFSFVRKDNPTRGLSSKEKNLILYVCAMVYQQNYNSSANINMVDY